MEKNHAEKLINALLKHPGMPYGIEKGELVDVLNGTEVSGLQTKIEDNWHSSPLEGDTIYTLSLRRVVDNRKLLQYALSAKDRVASFFSSFASYSSGLILNALAEDKILKQGILEMLHSFEGNPYTLIARLDNLTFVEKDRERLSMRPIIVIPGLVPDDMRYLARFESKHTRGEADKKYYASDSRMKNASNPWISSQARF